MALQLHPQQDTPQENPYEATKIVRLVGSCIDCGSDSVYVGVNESGDPITPSWCDHCTYNERENWTCKMCGGLPCTCNPPKGHQWFDDPKPTFPAMFFDSEEEAEDFRNFLANEGVNAHRATEVFQARVQNSSDPSPKPFTLSIVAAESIDALRMQVLYDNYVRTWRP